MEVKEESDKVGLKLNIQKTKIMASGPITSWEIDGETVSDFIFWGSKITANGNCSHEIKRCLLLGRKVRTNLLLLLLSRFSHVRPHKQQPTRLPSPWDSPGKNTGVGCHCLLQCMKVKSLSHVQLLVTPWTAAYQTPPSMGFSRQEYWSRVPLPSPASYLYRCKISSKILKHTLKLGAFYCRVVAFKACVIVVFRT